MTACGQLVVKLTTKKEIETLYLDAFLGSRPDLRLGSRVDSETPDFLYTTDNGILGIEITRFSPPVSVGKRPAEEQDSLRQRVMNLARSSYRTRGGAPVHVQAVFNERRSLSKARVSKLAVDVASQLLNSGANAGLSETFHVRDSVVLPELASLGATRVPTEQHGVWYGARGGWVRQADEVDIARTVAKKEMRIPACRQQCDVVWLLIVFLPHGNDILIKLPDEPILFAAKTKFSRVFCFDTFGPRSVEIPVNDDKQRHP
jgi:hypothetical protein